MAASEDLVKARVALFPGWWRVNLMGWGVVAGARVNATHYVDVVFVNVEDLELDYGVFCFWTRIAFWGAGKVKGYGPLFYGGVFSLESVTERGICL